MCHGPSEWAAIAFSQCRFEPRAVSPHALVRGARSNALIGWFAAGCVALTAVANLHLAPSIWAGYALLLVGVVAFPAVVTRDWVTMIHWPIAVVAAIAVILRVTGVVPEVAGYAAIVALALVIVVELDTFTSVELSRRFAVGFAVLTALAIEAVWIVVQFVADWWLGTAYLTTQTALQHDVVAVSTVSLAVGVVFYWYLTTYDQPESYTTYPADEAIQ